MRVQGAIVREQGITFGILIVKRHILNNRTEANRLLPQASAVFDGIPTILMAQENRGVPSYYGRQDIVNFMASVPLEVIPWKEYDLR